MDPLLLRVESVNHLERASLKGENEKAEPMVIGALATGEEPSVVAGEISEELGELALAMEDEDPPKSDRVKLDYARLLANAVRDRIDLEPSARIHGLIEALDGVKLICSRSGFHEPVVLLEAIQKLGRMCKGTQPAPC
jgi:hypothetical protein